VAHPTAWPQPAEQRGPAPGVEFAGAGARLGAYILDVVILGLVVSAIVVVSMLPIIGTIVSRVVEQPDYWSDSSAWSQLGGGIGFAIIGVVAASLVGLVYFPWFWARGGQTPGMRAAGIRVVRDRDGGPIDGGTAVLRLIGFWISGAVLYLGYLWIFVDERRRGWHDLLAGTCVISAR
jgi:uncharacterized RDD family membrane protein YckC